MPKALDLQGKRFGRLVVLCRAEVPNARNVMWQCRCDCGKTTIGAAANLGKTKTSCGCLASENGTAMLRFNRLARTDLHGKSHIPEWGVWSRMKDRCTNPNNRKYHRYGGRGISVCERWQIFENFFEDMGYRPSKKYSIDRVDNDGNYEPENCRWATMNQQSRNSTSVRMIEIEGVSMCIEDWCTTFNIPRSKPYDMIRKRGKNRDQTPNYATIEDALTALYHGRA